jgi:hypothetical protein
MDKRLFCGLLYVHMTSMIALLHLMINAETLAEWLAFRVPGEHFPVAQKRGYSYKQGRA